jgi:predicted acylesterase/phospholipase RssA
MRRRKVLGGLGAGLTVAACDAPARLASLPDKLRNNASFSGLSSDARFVLDGSDDVRMGQMAMQALMREVSYAEKSGAKGLRPATYLAISGGGENGAYGAGILTGWSALGTRPEFKGVTGVSTGALIAPFAFLGPAYDTDLARFYTTISQKDVMAPRGYISGLLGESLYDSTPLLHLIRSALTPEMVAAIAREYSDKGRVLMVGTANLDVPVGVMWNIGAIAASGRPDARDLVSRILLASASIPGAFPPVMIDLEADGQRFQEMHVDGGTVAQVMLYPPSFGGQDFLGDDTRDAVRLRNVVRRRPYSLYVIRNSRPGPDLETVDRSTLKIVGRAVSTLISTQGIGDLYQLYVLAERDGFDFNVTWIPPSFTEKPTEPFETAYMNRLFKVGRQAIEGGTAWSKYPPGYNPVPLGPVGRVGAR